MNWPDRKFCTLISFHVLSWKGENRFLGRLFFCKSNTGNFFYSLIFYLSLVGILTAQRWWRFPWPNLRDVNRNSYPARHFISWILWLVRWNRIFILDWVTNLGEGKLKFKQPILNLKKLNPCGILSVIEELVKYPYLPTPPLEQDMTQGQFLSGV